MDSFHTVFAFAWGEERELVTAVPMVCRSVDACDEVGALMFDEIHVLSRNNVCCSPLSQVCLLVVEEDGVCDCVGRHDKLAD